MGNGVDGGIFKQVSKHILVADDDNLVFHLLRHCLKDAAAAITFVTTGDAAVDFVSRNPVGMIIMDYTMPGLTGIEAVRQIRQIEHDKETAIIMLTGTDQTDVRREASSLAVADFITKPFSQLYILKRTKEILGDTGAVPEWVGKLPSSK